MSEPSKHCLTDYHHLCHENYSCPCECHDHLRGLNTYWNAERKIWLPKQVNK